MRTCLNSLDHMFMVQSSIDRLYFKCYSLEDKEVADVDQRTMMMTCSILEKWFFTWGKSNVDGTGGHRYKFNIWWHP